MGFMVGVIPVELASAGMSAREREGPGIKASENKVVNSRSSVTSAVMPWVCEGACNDGVAAWRLQRVLI